MVSQLQTDGSPGYWVGVDVGGTKIRAAVYSSTLQRTGSAKASTKSDRGPAAVVDRLQRCVRDALDEAEIPLERVCGLGVGAPGTVDATTGRVVFAPNLDWRDLPLRDLIEQALGVPVVVENDCKLSMFGVYEAELKRKPRHALGIFIGTGIGGGIVIGGELYGGYNQVAGEIGHMVLDPNGPVCSCGNRGCFEALASRTAILRRLEAAASQGPLPCQAEAVRVPLREMRSGDLRRALRSGDRTVAEAVQEAARYIGLAAGNLINALNPEVVVLGGGVIEALADEMMPTILRTARQQSMPGARDQVTLVASRLGDHAGTVGAAAWARQRFATEDASR